MKFVKFVKRIRNYAIASFLIPLIAINSCLLIYKYMGDLKIVEYPNLNWNQDEHTYTFEEYTLKKDDRESHRFNFCPKHEYFIIYTSIDNANGMLSSLRRGKRTGHSLSRFI